MKSQPEREQILAHFADAEMPDEFTFVIRRTQPPENLSFSQDVLDDFKDNLFLFVGGRIIAFHDKHDKPARSLKVTVKVEVGP